jgi:hypothetical protein
MIIPVVMMPVGVLFNIGSGPQQTTNTTYSTSGTADDSAPIQWMWWMSLFRQSRNRGRRRRRWFSRNDEEISGESDEYECIIDEERGSNFPLKRVTHRIPNSLV